MPIRIRPLAALALFAASFAAPALAAESAVVLMYHRFGESDFPSTNIRLEQFEAHIAELKSGAYTVLPLPEVVAALTQGRELQDRTVAITIDDAYASIYTEAWPRLKAAGLPFTVFVTTDPVDRDFAGIMTWENIRELRDGGVTIGHHTASHLHMAASAKDRNAEDVGRASARFLTELGEVPTLFAYPYGEASDSVFDVVREEGFTAAFGQHSGASHHASDPLYMPRFALNENYGDLDRFRLVANSLPIPAADIVPADPTLGVNPPLFGFTADAGIGSLAQLACYASGQGQARVEVLGQRVEVRLADAFAPGRARINCTMPAGGGRWRWFGMQFYVPAP